MDAAHVIVLSLSLSISLSLSLSLSLRAGKTAALCASARHGHCPRPAKNSGRRGLGGAVGRVSGAAGQPGALGLGQSPGPVPWHGAAMDWTRLRYELRPSARVRHEHLAEWTGAPEARGLGALKSGAPGGAGGAARMIGRGLLFEPTLQPNSNR